MNNEWISNLVGQFRQLPVGRQVALCLTALGSLAFFLWLGTGASRSDYRMLFRGLDEDEALAIVEGLEAEKIPYRLDQGGTAVTVPATLVHEARIRVAGRGLPGGGAGFEIFDNASFGVTDFVQKVNFMRAVQGELARSIEQLDPVDRARVQLAMPERSAFVREDSTKGSASVVVRLRSGAELTTDQVQGIVHLVSSSVQHLPADAVTVVDTRGRMLAPVDESHAGPRAPAGALAQQARVERELAGRVESILARTVGAGRVVARVAADLDWTQTELTEERFDPDSQVARSEQRSTESSRDSDGGGPPQGVPGVRSNQPETAAERGGTGSQRTASTSSETINYEISKVVSRRIEPVGRVRRLDVAVLVDGKPGDEAADFAPWSAEELTQFEDLAKRAVGFSDERGDQITVTSAPFRSLELVDPEGLVLTPQLLALLSTALNYLGLILALVLFARFVGRPIIAALTEDRGDGAMGMPLTAAQLEAQLAGQAAGLQDGSAAAALGLPQAHAPSLSEQVGSLTDARGEESVRTLRGWLDQ